MLTGQVTETNSIQDLRERVTLSEHLQPSAREVVTTNSTDAALLATTNSTDAALLAMPGEVEQRCTSFVASHGTLCNQTGRNRSRPRSTFLRRARAPAS